MTALDVDQPLPGMPDPHALAPAALDPRIPDLEGEIHHGIKVASVGEDGDMLAFGHHDPKATLSAMNAYAKRLGFLDLLDDGKHDADAWKQALERVKPCWAVQMWTCHEHRAEAKPVAECLECQWVDESTWFVDCSAAEDAPGSFPVMLWTAG